MRSGRFSLGKLISHLVLITWCCTIGTFLFWLVTSSFKTNRTVFAKLWTLPESWNLANFQKVLSSLSFGRYALNSVIVVVVAVILMLLVSALAAHGLTRMKIRFARAVTMIYIGGMGVPVQLLFVPLFKTLRGMELVDTLPGLMLVYMTVSIPFTVFLLTGFFTTIPTELEEAAYIDGCNLFQTFYKIMLPIATPGLVTAAIFNSIILWNEYMMALIFITSKENKTLSLGLFGLQQALHYTGDWVAVFTACLLATIPTVLLYVLLAEKLVSGITVGAIKS